MSEHDVYCMAQGSTNSEVYDNLGSALTCMHEHPIIFKGDAGRGRHYIVRRLTPTECCRLQGFPDGWGEPTRKDEIPGDEAQFWEEVRRQDAETNGKKYTPCKNGKQLAGWYNKLHSDANEYKMWGNGLTLPCAAFVLRRIAENEQE